MTDPIAAVLAERRRAWAARDVTALMAVYSEDCVVESQISGTLNGRPALEASERQFFGEFPDIAYEEGELMIVGNRAVMTATVSGTDENGRLTSPGTRFRFPVVLLCTIEHGRIVLERRIWDFSAFVLQRVQRDLDLAGQIQQQLLPDSSFAGHGFDVAAASVPCRAVGGDFFDYYELPGGRFALAVGDVAGKGPASALIGASLQAILSVSDHLAGPAAILGNANRAMLRRPVPSRYATVVYALLSADGRLTYCNAGHNPPLLLGRDGLQWLGKGGTIVGMFEGATFEEESLQLHQGDRLVVFSDGITEALSVDGTEFGDDRLVSCVRGNEALPPALLVKRILETVQLFSAGTTQSDDRTVLVLSYSGRTQNV